MAHTALTHNPPSPSAAPQVSPDSRPPQLRSGCSPAGGTQARRRSGTAHNTQFPFPGFSPVNVFRQTAETREGKSKQQTQRKQTRTRRAGRRTPALRKAAPRGLQPPRSAEAHSPQNSEAPHLTLALPASNLRARASSISYEPQNPTAPHVTRRQAHKFRSWPPRGFRPARSHSTGQSRSGS